ncbi:amidohydrolase family protein [Jannaschia rubra]|uniref:Putative metal-dependent hydrolase of the TIM-barrel fold protein n=1 Tax=Jannaschia rubra TaxID=282197 RepID=A0A0M6XRX6_9RHOB|nr:amidohydrolase family protein [Jannaschia rubra]CTQ32905.1 putative metal-dependent hydrolase of the TIM-barrel fold protein [Jannaschia rubra]SFG27958.1 Predicted metal-dependent hydrolase, TIM-barrel fold [Jannaschia rubra]
MTLPRSAPPPSATAPRRAAPPGACDTHVHILGGTSDGHLSPDRVEDPAEGWSYGDYLSAYRAQMAALGIERTVVVQSTLYGTDNTLTARAIDDLGRDCARGIGLVTDDATDGDLDHLSTAGFEGVRLNYVHGGVLSWDGVEAMAPRLADYGLHVQMLLMAHRHLEPLAPRIAAMPVPVVLDHIAWPDVTAGLEEPGFRCLLSLMEQGKVWVKLSGLYRHCAAPFDAVDGHVAALLEANPLRCLWGSDWPQIMLNGAARAEPGALLDAFDRVCPNDDVRQAVLVDNPERLYGF